MVSRKIFALFVIALMAVSVRAAPVEELDVDIDEELERLQVPKFIKDAAKAAIQKAIKETVEYLKEKAQNVNLDCVKEIYETCDINPILHPKKYYKCAKKYFLDHKEHCYLSDE